MRKTTEKTLSTLVLTHSSTPFTRSFAATLQPYMRVIVQLAAASSASAAKCEENLSQMSRIPQAGFRSWIYAKNSTKEVRLTSDYHWCPVKH